ncbi:MAG: flagellar hook-associated protein FlgK [Pseudomonadota bacterium]
MSGILGIAVTGLQAAQAGIRTTEHNIANVNTAGYRRQEVTFSATQPQYTGMGYFGTGVATDAVRRIYNQFLDNEVLQNQAQLSRHSTYATQAGQIDKMLGDGGSGLSSALDAFFDAANELANDPTSNAARQNFMSSGSNLAARINSLDGKLRNMRDSTNADISTLADRVNTLSSQIASLNVSVAQAEAVNGRPANDLRDQRDQLLAELNKLVNVTTLEQGDGMVNVFIGSGQALVVGNSANSMSTTLDPSDTSSRIPVLNVAGSTVQLDSRLVSGGELGGILAQREEVLIPALDDLNRIAMGLAGSVNALHRAGYDYTGTAGVDFFSNPLVAQGTVTGALEMTVSNDLLLDRQGYQITATAGGYDVTVLSTGVTTSYASVAAVNAAGLGFNLSVTTAPVPGDTWIMGDYARNISMALTSTTQVAAAGSTGGPGDNTNALALAQLRNDDILNNGTISFSETYAQTISRTASLASNADLSRSAYTALVEQSTADQLSASGVNLDEEAVNLIKFQQAYQASAKAIQVASSLFDELIGVLR